MNTSAAPRSAFVMAMASSETLPGAALKGLEDGPECRLGALPTGSGRTGDGTAVVAIVCLTVGRKPRLSNETAGLPTRLPQSLQPLPQERVAPGRVLPLNSHRQRLATADDGDEL